MEQIMAADFILFIFFYRKFHIITIIYLPIRPKLSLVMLYTLKEVFTGIGFQAFLMTESGIILIFFPQENGECLGGWRHRCHKGHHICV